MTIGRTVSKTELDQDMGDLAVDLIRAFRKVEELHRYLLITPDAALVAKGYTDGTGGTVNEVAIIKSAWTDMDTARATWQGLRVNLDQLAGALIT